MCCGFTLGIIFLLEETCLYALFVLALKLIKGGFNLIISVHTIISVYKYNVQLLM